MATNNVLNIPLTGQTGSVNFVGSNSPVLINPSLGAATATTIAFSPTTNGIVGTPTNNDAAAGIVGEYVTSQVLFASPVSMTSGILTNVTSISITAGDWDLNGNLFIQNTGPSMAFSASISTVSATHPDLSFASFYQSTVLTPFYGVKLGFRRISIAVTTTCYLVLQINFPSGSVNASGGISARRVR